MTKVIQKHDECIGCGSCVAVCPKYWEFGEDGKVYPKGGTKNSATGEYELEIKEAECNQEAADSCPVQVIFLRD